MPIVYQGRLMRDPPAPPLKALHASRGLWRPICHSMRTDLWLAWETPEALHRAASLLPPEFDGFWLEITARAEATQIGQYLAWAAGLRGGRLGLVSQRQGHGGEVWLQLAGRASQRADLDPAALPAPAAGREVGYRENVEGGGGAERAARRLARLRAAYEALGADLPFREWAASLSGARPGGWTEMTATTPRAPWGGDAPTLRTDPAMIRGRARDGRPVSLRARVPGEQAATLWRHWLGLMPQVDLLTVRCRGTLESLRPLLEALEVHRAPDRPTNAYGLSTVGAAEAPPEEVLEGLLTHPELDEALLDWGLRHSDLRLALGGPLDAPRRASASAHFVQSDRGRRLDGVRLELPLDDLDGGAFRSARRRLSSALDPEMALEAAWTQDGDPVDSPAGQAHLRVVQVLREARGQVLNAPAPVPRPPHPAPPWAGVLRRIRGRGRYRPGLVELLEEALGDALPGFRHDRRAHVTDLYFVELSRPGGGGCTHLLRLRRLHAPAGHEVRVGIAARRLRMADLDPSPGRILPGLAFPLAELVPELSPLVWRYRSAEEARVAVAHTVEVLRLRAGAYFEAAERALAARPSDPREVE